MKIHFSFHNPTLEASQPLLEPPAPPPTASSFSEGQQHLLAHRLINWLIRRLQCKLIDWLSWGWSCLYLEPRGAKLWRSTLICHVQHTGEDEGEMKSCGFITKTLGGGEGMFGGSLSQDGSMPSKQWEHGDKRDPLEWNKKVVCYWHGGDDGWMKDAQNGKRTVCLVWTVLRWFIHTDVKLG